MKKQSVYDAFDEFRKVEQIFKHQIILGRMLNYIEVNIDDFIECYEQDDEKIQDDFGLKPEDWKGLPTIKE